MTKILLVEDDKSLREIYGVRLLAEGYDIVSAGDGEEALAMAIKEKPTLIISDVMMPKISGFDMLDILRSTTETRDIKVIMMTALSSDDQRSRGEQLGADKYLVKSQVGIEDVVRTVHEVLGDAPGAASSAAAASAVTAPVVDTPPVSEQPTPTPAADDAASSTPVSDTPDPITTTDNTDTVVSDSTASAPGNEEAGPLPPQPTETSLPQPTAPFASPRPATLGERIIQPLENTTEPLSSEAIAQELQAAAEPVSAQVDQPATESASDTPFEAPIIAPSPVEQGVVATEPVVDSTSPVDLTAPAVTDPAEPATATSDEKPATPPIS